MYRKFKLDDDQLAEVERLQLEQAKEFREKVYMILELGSDYSSEFEEVEVSELVSVSQEPVQATVIREDGSVSSSLEGIKRSMVSPKAQKAGTKTPNEEYTEK